MFPPTQWEEFSCFEYVHWKIPWLGKKVKEASAEHLRVDEGDHDVASSLGNAQAFVVVGQTSGVHQDPALLGVTDGAVVPRIVVLLRGIEHCYINMSEASEHRQKKRALDGRALIRSLIWMWFKLECDQERFQLSCSDCSLLNLERKYFIFSKARSAK